MSSIAIIFPGIGYHSDKPLLYYSKKLAAEAGYQIIEVKYSGFDTDIRGNAEKMRLAAEHALAKTEEILNQYEFSAEDEILCISKSVGTVVSAIWQKKAGIRAKNVFFTPVEATFSYAAYDSGIVFHGTKDPWVETAIVQDGCERLHFPLFITPEGNHSLESGRAGIDLLTVARAVELLQDYLMGRDMWENANNKEMKGLSH